MNFVIIFIVLALFFYKDSFGIKYPTKIDIPFRTMKPKLKNEMDMNVWQTEQQIDR